MQRWIMEKTEEHFQEAMMENKNHFRAVDPDGDGGGSRIVGSLPKCTESRFSEIPICCVALPPSLPPQVM